VKVLVIGSGPIVIGQAAEFDYAGTQACRALREEGHVTVLVNSNPATIMTDQGVADRTYVEPLTPEFLERIIDRERPDALLAEWARSCPNWKRRIDQCWLSVKPRARIDRCKALAHVDQPSQRPAGDLDGNTVRLPALIWRGGRLTFRCAAWRRPQRNSDYVALAAEAHLKGDGRARVAH